MPWIREIYYAGATADVVYKFAARYGKKGIPRGGNANLTTEEQAAINQRRSERRLRILINHNFRPGDYYLTLTYQQGCRPEPAEAKRELERYLKRLRRAYRKAGLELKYIAVTEYHNRAIHHHLIINAIPIDQLPDWRYVSRRQSAGDLPLKGGIAQHGHPKLQLLDDTGDYSQLASYLIKETSKTFRAGEGPGRKRWSGSRNLIMPKPKVTILQTARWSKDPKAPKGYHILKDTIRCGFRGDEYEYMEYRAIRTTPASGRCNR